MSGLPNLVCRANSIGKFNSLLKCLVLLDYAAGNKVNNVDVVYTPWANLKKTASMDVGQVGFHNPKMVSSFVLWFNVLALLQDS